jgi:hypothetical protein
MTDADIITTADARTIASEWHSGQASALYAFSSSGFMDRSDMLREIDRDLKDAHAHHAQDVYRLRALRAFVLASPDWRSDAYKAGVSETFQTACETELRKWLPDADESAE